MAFLVRDWDDLQLAYLLLKDCPKNSQKLVDLKRSIREYNRDVNEETCVKIIKDYGIDGYISLEMLPEDIDNEADAICIGKYFAHLLKNNKQTWGESI